MLKTKEPILLAWTGGKDSVMALVELRRSKEFEVVGLLTAVSEESGRIVLHGTCQDLLTAQAEALGLPLVLIPMPETCSRSYIEKLGEAVRPYRDQGIHTVAFGDLYLDDIRDFREEQLEHLGMEAVFPLWHRDPAELALAFLREKFKAVVLCVEESCLPASFVGRAFDRSFLADLPLGVDPCGENGEFHTFVYDGPLFAKPVRFRVGETFNEACFHYCDMAKTTTPAARPRRTASRSR